MIFLEKYELLKKSIPVAALVLGNSVDCEYSDFITLCKNCYYCFDASYIEDSMYVVLGAFNKNLVDCLAMADSEKCYGCVESTKCHSSTYLLHCNNCTDCHFSSYLNACSDCFGCVGLNHKKYCIFNKQYSKVEYFKKIEELKSEKPENLLEQMRKLKKQIPHPATYQSNSENCPFGNYVYNSNNCYWIFNTFYFENCGYAYYSAIAKNCWDMYCSGGSKEENGMTEKCYEMVASRPSNYECAYQFISQYCTNCYYGIDLRNCSDCFGCVGLTNKKYCILNNQLTKERYENAVKEIKKELGWKV